MSGTGKSAWVGYPPVVAVVERVLLSQIPEEERGRFMEFMKGKHEFTRSGEPVFPKSAYDAWKKLH